MTKCNRRIQICADKKAQDLKTNNNKEIGVPFSLKLDIDLFQSGNIHLGQAYTNGLMLTIHLAPDSSVLFQRFRNKATDATASAAMDLSNTMYVLRNLETRRSLHCSDSTRIKGISSTDSTQLSAQLTQRYPRRPR